MNLQRFQHEIEALVKQINDESTENIHASLCSKYLEITKTFSKENVYNFEELAAGLEFSLRTYIPFRRKFSEVQDEADELGHLLFMECARLVLGVEFQRLGEEDTPKVTLKRTIGEAYTQLQPFPMVGHMFLVLPWLMVNSWSHPTLVAMMGGEDIDEETAFTYLKSGEYPEIFRLRIEMLIEGGVDAFALNLCNWCAKSDTFKEDLSVRKSQFKLMHRLEKRSEFLNECYHLNCCLGVKIIEDFKDDNEFQSAGLMMAQSLLIQDLTKQSNHCCTKALIRSWLTLERSEEPDEKEFLQSVSKVSSFITKPEQLIDFSAVMIDLFKSSYLQFCTELLLKAIKTERYKLDSARIMKNEHESNEAADCLGKLCYQIACLYEEQTAMYLSSLLTTLYLDPTVEIYSKLQKLMTDHPELAEDVEDSEDVPSPDGIEKDLYHDIFENVETLRPGVFHIREGWEDLKKTIFHHMEQCGYSYNESEDTFVTDSDSDAETIDYPLQEEKDVESVQENLDEGQSTPDELSSEKELEVVQDQTETSPSSDIEDPGGGQEREKTSDVDKEAVENNLDSLEIESNSEQATSNEIEIQEVKGDSDSNEGSMEIDEEEHCKDIKSVSSKSQAPISDFQKQFMNFMQIARSEDEMNSEEETNLESPSSKTEKELMVEEETKLDKQMSSTDQEMKKETLNTDMEKEVVESDNKRNEQLNKIETIHDEADMLRFKLDQTLSSVLGKRTTKSENVNEKKNEDKTTVISENKENLQEESVSASQIEVQTERTESGVEGTININSLAICDEENTNEADEASEKDTSLVDISSENMISQGVDENMSETSEKAKKRHEYMCNYCGKVFDTMLKRRRHQEWICTKKDFFESKSMACEICGKQFRTDISLKKHYTQFHRVSEPVKSVFDGVKLPQGVNCNVANCEVSLSPLGTEVVAKYESQPVMFKRGRGRPRKVETPPLPQNQKKKGHKNRGHKRSFRTRDTSGFYKEWSESETDDEETSSVNADEAVSSQEEDQESTHSSIYECKHCDLTFTNMEESDKHKKLCSLTVDLLGLVTCNDCGANFEGKKSLREHIIVCEKGRKKYDSSQGEDVKDVKVEMTPDITGPVASTNETQGVDLKDKTSDTSLDIKFAVDYCKPSLFIENNFLMYKYTTAGRCPACAKIFETGKECNTHQNKECFPERGVKIIVGFQCVFCKNNFLTPKICRAHMQKECQGKTLHTEKRKCKLCSKLFSSLQNYLAHLSQVHKNCSSPSTDFIQNSGERTTITSEDKEINEIKQYSCSKCALIFYNHKDINKHCETVCKGADFITVKRFECNKCSHLFEDIPQLSDHSLLCQGLNMLSIGREGAVIYSGSKFSCLICKASFLQRRYVFDHLNRKHQDIEPKDRPRHVVEVKDPNPLMEIFKCNICAKKFPYNMSVVRHIRCDHPEIPEHLLYANITTVKQAIKTTGDNEKMPEVKKRKLFSYKCSLCGKVLSSKFLVKKHITRLHPNLCPEEFDKNIQKIERVEQTKTFEKQKTDDQAKTSLSPKKACRKMWRCKLCKKEYIEYETLLSHLGKDHTDEEKQSYFNAMKKASQSIPMAPIKKYYFKCKVCHTKLSSRGLAKEHITITHPQVSPQEIEQMILYVPPEQGTTEIKEIVNKPIQTAQQLPATNCLFHCNICRTKFTSQQMVTDHISLQHPEIPRDFISKYITGTEEHVVNFSCRLCAAVYGQKETALNHIRQSHQSLLLGRQVEEFIQVCDVVDQYQCQVCGDKLKTLDAGKVHLSTRHNLIVIGVEQCRKFITPVNPPPKVEPKVPEKAEGDITNHLFAVEVKKALQYRVKKDPQKIPMRYTCQVCQKEFIQLYYAKLHMRVKHADLPSENRLSYISQEPLEKIFKCTVCGSTFKDQNVAMSHLQEIHLGNNPANQRPEACITVEYNTKKKSGKSNKIRKVFCDLCGTTFDKMTNAKTHFTDSHPNIIVTDWKPKKALCLQCKKEFENMGDGEKHVQAEHSGIQNCDVENILAHVLEKRTKKVAPKKKYQCKLCHLKITGHEIARKHYEEKHQESNKELERSIENVAIGEAKPSLEVPDNENVAKVESFDITKYFTVLKKNFSCNVCKLKGYSKAFITRHRSKKHNITAVLSNEVHICGLCYKVFTTERSWTAHMRLSHKDIDKDMLEQNRSKFHKKHSFKFDYLYKCAVCDQQFKDLDVIEFHLATAHSEISKGYIEANRDKYIINLNPVKKAERFGCRLCKKLFSNIQKAEQHLLNHHKDQCLKGDGRFHTDFITTVDRLELEQEQLPKMKYLCKLCKSNFQNVSEAQNHIMAVHHMTHLNDGIKNNVLSIEISQEVEHSDQTKSEKSFCCTLCGDSFQDIPKTERHLIKCHSDVKKEEVMGNIMKKKEFMKLAIGCIFVCRACNYNFEGTKAQVKQHITERHPEIKEESVQENIRKVSLLKKVPKQGGDQNIHQRIKLQKIFECNICAYQAGTKCTLRKHIRNHHSHISYDDINDYIKRFTTPIVKSPDKAKGKKTLVHQESVKMACNILQQKKEIKKNSDHFFKCKICGHQFMFKQSGRSHIKRRHSDIPYEEINKNLSRESKKPEGMINKDVSKKARKAIEINKAVTTESPKRLKKIIQLIRLCKICGWKTTERCRALKHLKSNHPEIPEENMELCFEKFHKKLVYRCKKCIQVLETENDIYVHIAEQHGIQESAQMLEIIEKISMPLNKAENTERTTEDIKQRAKSSGNLGSDISIPNKTVQTELTEVEKKEKGNENVIKMSPYDLQKESKNGKEESGKAIVGNVLDSELNHFKSLTVSPKTTAYQQCHQQTITTTSYAVENSNHLANVTSRISCNTIDSNQYTNTSQIEGGEKHVPLVQTGHAQTSTDTVTSKNLQTSQQNSLMWGSISTSNVLTSVNTSKVNVGNVGATANTNSLEEYYAKLNKAQQESLSTLKVSPGRRVVKSAVQHSDREMQPSLVGQESLSTLKVSPGRSVGKSAVQHSERELQPSLGVHEALPALKVSPGKGVGKSIVLQSHGDIQPSIGVPATQAQKLTLNHTDAPSKQMIISPSTVNHSAYQQYVPHSSIVSQNLQPSYTVPTQIEMAAPPNVTLLSNSQALLGQGQEVLSIGGTQNIYVQNQQEMDVGPANMLLAPGNLEVLVQPTDQQQISVQQLQQTGGSMGIVLHQPTQQPSQLQLQQNAEGKFELVVPTQQQSVFQMQEATVNLGVVIPTQQTQIQVHQDTEGNLVMHSQQENPEIQMQQTSDGNMMYANSQPQVLSYSVTPQTLQGGGILLAQQSITSNNLPQNVMATRVENRNARIPQCLSVPKPVTTPVRSSLTLSQSNKTGTVREELKKKQAGGAATIKALSPGKVNTSLNNSLQLSGSYLGVNSLSSPNFMNVPSNTGKKVRSPQQTRPRAPLSVPQPQVIMSSGQSLQNRTHQPTSVHRPKANQQRLPASVLANQQRLPASVLANQQRSPASVLANQQRLPASVLANKKTSLVVAAKDVITLSPTQTHESFADKPKESPSSIGLVAPGVAYLNNPTAANTPIRLSEVVSQRFLPSSKQFDCTACGEIFLDEKSLKAHTENKCTVCKPCKTSFANRELMKEHLRDVHGQAEQAIKLQHANVINFAPINKVTNSKASKESGNIPNLEVLHVQKSLPPRDPMSPVSMTSLLSIASPDLSLSAANTDHNYQENVKNQTQHLDVMKNSLVASVVSNLMKGAEGKGSVKQEQMKSQEINQELSSTCTGHNDEKKCTKTDTQEEKPQKEMHPIVTTVSEEVTNKTNAETPKEEAEPVISVEVPPMEELVKKTSQTENTPITVSEGEQETEHEAIVIEDKYDQVESEACEDESEKCKDESDKCKDEPQKVKCEECVDQHKKDDSEKPESEVEKIEAEKGESELEDDESEKTSCETDMKEQIMEKEIPEKPEVDTDQESCRDELKDEEESPSENDNVIHVATLSTVEQNEKEESKLDVAIGIIDDIVSNTLEISVINVSQMLPHITTEDIKEGGESSLPQEELEEIKMETCVNNELQTVNQVEEADSQNTGSLTPAENGNGDQIISQENDLEQGKENISSMVVENDLHPTLSPDEIKEEYLKCQHCAVNICFKSGDDLKQHMKLVHGDPNMDDSNFSMVCAICRDQAIFVTELDFKCHMKWMHHVNWVKPKQLGRTGSTESESSSNESQVELIQEKEKETKTAKRGRPRKKVINSKVTAKNLPEKQGILRATPERLSNRAIEKTNQKVETNDKNDKEPSNIKRPVGNKPISPGKVCEVGSGKKWGMRNLAARRAGRAAAANLLQKSKTSAMKKALNTSTFQKSEKYTQRQLAYLRNQTTTDTYNQVKTFQVKAPEPETKVDSKNENENLTKKLETREKEKVLSPKKARKSSCSGQEDGLTRRSTRLSTSPNKDLTNKRQTRQMSPKKEKPSTSREKIAIQCPWKLLERKSKVEANKSQHNSKTKTSKYTPGQGKSRKVGRPPKSKSEEVQVTKASSKEEKTERSVSKNEATKHINTSTGKDVKSMKNSQEKEQNVKKRESSRNSISPTRKKQTCKLVRMGKNVTPDVKKNGEPDNLFLNSTGDKFTKRVVPSGPRDIAARIKTMKKQKRSIRAKRKEMQEKTENVNIAVNPEKETKNQIETPKQIERISPEQNFVKEKRKKHIMTTQVIQYEWQCAVCSTSFKDHLTWSNHVKTHSEAERRIKGESQKECGHFKRQPCECSKAENSDAKKTVEKMVQNKVEENSKVTSPKEEVKKGNKAAKNMTQPSGEATAGNIVPSQKETKLSESEAKRLASKEKTNPADSHRSETSVKSSGIEKITPPVVPPGKEATNLPKSSPSKAKVSVLPGNKNAGIQSKEQKNKLQENKSNEEPILSKNQGKKTPSATPAKNKANKTRPLDYKGKALPTEAKSLSTPPDVSKPTKTRRRSVTNQKTPIKDMVTGSSDSKAQQTAVKKSYTKHKKTAHETKKEGIEVKKEGSEKIKGPTEENLNSKTSPEQKEMVYCSSDDEVSFSATPLWKKSNPTFDDTWTKRSETLSPPIKTYQRPKVKRRSSEDSISGEEHRRKDKKAEPLQKEEASPASMYDGIKNRKRARSNSTDSNVSVHSASKSDIAGKGKARTENTNTKISVENLESSKERAKRARSCSPDSNSAVQINKQSKNSSPSKQNGLLESTKKESSKKLNTDSNENRRISRSRTLSSSSNVSDVSASSSRSRTGSRTSERNSLSTLNEIGRDKEKPKTRHQMAEEAKNNNLVLRNARQVSKTNDKGRWIQAPAGVIKTPISSKAQMTRRSSINLIKMTNKRKATASPQTHSVKRKK